MGIGLTASESTRTFIFLAGPLNILRMAGADEAELREAFKLFDTDGDGVITMEELKGLISKVGGDMSEAEAIAHIKSADADATWPSTSPSLENFGQLFTVQRRTRSEESLPSWMLIRAATLPKRKCLV